jgi:3-hydroxybutyrate dehydrogenase
MQRIPDKVAIVTGAACGIGKQIALTLARAGAIVAVADLDPAGVKAVAQQIRKNGGQAIGMALDVTNEIAVNKAIDEIATQFGHLDVLVSNAGIQIVNTLELYSFSDWRKMQAMHVDGAFLTTRAALKHMYKDDRGGTVIYIGSMHSHEASPLKCAHVAAHHALLGMAHVLAKEGARHNVRSHMVCSGFVHPSLTASCAPAHAQAHGSGSGARLDEDTQTRRVEPAGRTEGLSAPTADVAQTVLYLACAAN